MGYVGNQTTNSYSSMDKQVITGNGGASYILTHAVANAQEIEVFVNNVRQEAGVAYTVNGTALSMTGNVASTDDFYVIYQGKALQTVVPPDGSVSTGKLASGAVTTAKINDGAVTRAKFASGAAGNILETLVLVCNGDSITVPSGTYTSANVNALQALTDTHTVVDGSSISYTPPSGATSVIYEFNFMGNWQDVNGITHLKMEIDGTEVTQSRQNPSHAGTYDQFRYTFKWRIPIGGTADAATGRQASWTGAKTLRLKMRRYNSTYDVNLFERRYWDGVSGTGSTGVERPVLTITALS